MFIILGADGHVGSAVAGSLLAQGLPVTAVLHKADQAQAWEQRGAVTAVADVLDTDALRRIFQTGTRAFLLNPPADVSTDTDAAEHATADSIVRALGRSGLEKIVLASTFGAQPGDRIGDLSVLYDFEQAAVAQSIPLVIQRGAYYFSNWDMQLDEARGGTLTTMFPADLKLPMISPADLGRAAAARLTEPYGDTELHHVEGPERYSARDVAAIFASALGRSVDVVSLPKDAWEGSYKTIGFSQSAAKAYARMTAATVEGDFPDIDDTEKGRETLEDYIAALIQRA